MLLQWHVKDPGHSAKCVDGSLHPNMHTRLTLRSRGGLSVPLSTHSVGTFLETSSHATRQGTSSHSRLSSLSHLKKKKKAQVRNEWSNILPKSSQASKMPSPWRRRLLKNLVLTLLRSATSTQPHPTIISYHGSAAGGSQGKDFRFVVCYLPKKEGNTLLPSQFSVVH